MVDHGVPDDIEQLAEERAQARAGRDWAAADALKGRIEAAGWRVVDDGLAYTLSAARPPDRIVDGATWYGSAEAVPSRLEEPPTLMASVIVVVPADTSVQGTLEGLAAHDPGDVEVLVVACGEDPVEGPATEVIRTSERFGPADAITAALRRCRGELVVVLEAGRVPSGDIVAPLRAALADPTVAVAGIEGLVSADLRRYRPVREGEATALRAGCYAFRRGDQAAMDGLDRRLNLPGSVATAISLELRDAGPHAEPRKALAMELPLAATDGELPADHARLARRDAYRLDGRFRDRGWLAEGEPPQRRLVGDGAGRHDQDDEAHQAKDASEP